MSPYRFYGKSTAHRIVVLLLWMDRNGSSPLLKAGWRSRPQSGHISTLITIINKSSTQTISNKCVICEFSNLQATAEQIPCHKYCSMISIRFWPFSALLRLCCVHRPFPSFAMCRSSVFRLVYQPVNSVEPSFPLQCRSSADILLIPSAGPKKHQEDHSRALDTTSS